MKIPKHVSLTTGTLVLAILLGVVIASHNPAPQPTHVDFNETGITQPAEPAPAETTPAAATSITTPAVQAQAASADTTPPSVPAQNDPTPPADPPAPVVAVSAAVSDWSDPVPTDSRFGIGTNPLPTVVRYRYCLWTYSDGSTQKRTYAAKYSTVSGGMSYLDDPTYDCTVATAP